MARSHYRNGDEISLSCGCDGCSPSMINGVLCHEHGCPDAWRDHTAECFECGCDFLPRERGQRICDDCADPEPAFLLCGECGAELDHDSEIMTGMCSDCLGDLCGCEEDE